jgi:hypothetical protein
MTKIKKIFTTFTVSVVLVAAVWAEPDVYVAGYAKNVGACYWKNGQQIALSGGREGSAQSIAVSGDDVHVAGTFPSGSWVVGYWKNGTLTVLTNGRTEAGPRAIVVSGGDVYIAGYEGGAACYWKNGEKIVLTGGSGAHDIAVSGRDVYVAGETNIAGTPAVCYWKNGVKTDLTDGKNYAYAYGIAVSGNDVYVAGREQAGVATACYWKNGVKTVLGDRKEKSGASVRT